MTPRLDPAGQTARFATYGLVRLRADRRREGPAHPELFSKQMQRAYPFTTENLVDFVDRIGVAGQAVAAICGSGDFGINALAGIARSVDSVDVMPTACMYAEFKTAGLAGLGRSEFLAFFNGAHSFGHERYARIRDQLSQPTRDYFDQLITARGPHEFLLDGFFIDKLGDRSMPERMNPYLQSDGAYLRAAQNAGAHRFHPVSMADFLASTQPRTYGVIYLSNAFAYMPEVEIENLMAIASTRLQAGGRIVAYSSLPVEGDPIPLGLYNRRLARRHGLEATHLTGTVPHMGPSHRSIICVMTLAPH